MTIAADFKIPIPKIPTAEEMTSSASEWWKRQEHINFLDWNQTLKNNSFPFYEVKLLPELVEEMLSIPEEPHKFKVVLSEVDIAIKSAGISLSDGMFFKLISRSPKDFNKTCFAKHSQQVVNSLLSSMRCFDDLCLLVYIDKCYLIFRPFIQIRPENEFRALVHEGSITGISQYIYTQRFNYTSDRLIHIERTIRNFTDNIITPNVGIKSFVCDYALDANGRDITLIELNPYGLSDPCLFQSYDKLDGSFRVAK